MATRAAYQIPFSRLPGYWYIEVDEVLQFLPPDSSASIFVKLAYDPMDYLHHRVTSILQADIFGGSTASQVQNSEHYSLTPIVPQFYASIIFTLPLR